jgi:hypothetical protein
MHPYGTTAYHHKSKQQTTSQKWRKHHIHQQHHVDAQRIPAIADTDTHQYQYT